MFDKKKDRQRTIHWFKCIAEALNVSPQPLIDAYRVKIEKRPDMDLDKITTEEIWSACVFFETCATVGDMGSREIYTKWGKRAQQQRRLIEREEHDKRERERCPPGFGMSDGLARCARCSNWLSCGPRGSRCKLTDTPAGVMNTCDEFECKYPQRDRAIHDVKIEITCDLGGAPELRPADSCRHCEQYKFDDNERSSVCKKHRRKVGGLNEICNDFSRPSPPPPDMNGYKMPNHCRSCVCFGTIDPYWCSRHRCNVQMYHVCDRHTPRKNS